MNWTRSADRWRLAPSAAPSVRRLAILLHGVGSGADAIRWLGEEWAATVPGLAVSALDGPEPFDGGGAGRQWFSLAGITPDERNAEWPLRGQA